MKNTQQLTDSVAVGVDHVQVGARDVTSRPQLVLGRVQPALDDVITVHRRRGGGADAPA